MVSAVLASVLQSYLGQYLELSDSSISVGSEVRLNNVKLKESALSDLGLPVKCVHGKVSRLVIKIPWLNLFTSKTKIEIEGLHLLVVPSSSVKFDEQKELLEQNEAKQKRLERAEQAKQVEQEQKKAVESGDSFGERLVANIIKNLEVTIRRVHLRYEDKQTGSGRYPFAAGVTLDSILMNTVTESNDAASASGGKIKLKVFKKNVELNSLALYWRPKANLYSEEGKARDEAIDMLFDTSIGTRENPSPKMKYLLGPISSDASLQWCPNPATSEYQVPEVDLNINMSELCLSLTKYQYQDFVMLLQSFEFMSRASQFRKYKARNGLDNLPNYHGHLKNLWKFAFDCIYEEEVTRKLNNWSWEHMKEHITRCKDYRSLYKKKLATTKQLPDDLKKQLRRLEDQLDEVNIRIQRQLAEREVEQQEKLKKLSAPSGGGLWGWFSGTSKKPEDGNSDSSGVGNNIKKLGEALTNEEKSKLYEVLDYQENAHHGIFPKSFVAKKMRFTLDCLLITIHDDDLNDAVALKLCLDSVTSELRQRPSADYIQLEMTMKTLTVTGLEKRGSHIPVIICTRAGSGSNLLNVSFENNPPSNPDGDLDQDQGSLYDQRIRFLSSPLEITYDARTFNRLLMIFKTPDDLNLANLQQTAYSKLQEYKATTTLGLQYVIENHNLIDVDIQLMSSYIIIPHKGTLTESCACAIANLGSIKVKSRPISAETRSLKDMSLKDLTDTFKRSLRDQAYDKFNVTLENMQLIVAMPHEEWRSHVTKEISPLFLLKPTSLRVIFQYCLIKNDPEMPLTKIKGSLEEISINISDYRLIKLAQILDSLLERNEEEQQNLHRSESEESMQSALSSLANTGSLIQSAVAVANVPNLAPIKKQSSMDGDALETLAQITKVIVDFSIGKVNLSLTQQVPHSNEDQKLFHFTLMRLDAHTTVRTFDMVGTFSVGGLTCEHLLLKTPSLQPVRILRTQLSDGQDDTLLELTYTDINKLSPDFHTVHRSILKNLHLRLSTVCINFHQDAILDLIDKITKFVTEVTANAKNLIMAVPEKPEEVKIEEAVEAKGDGEEESGLDPSDQLKRQNARKAYKRRLSVKTPANLARWAFRAKKKVSLQSEEIELKVTAKLESVKFDFMTSKVHLCVVDIKDLKASYVQTKSQKLITARLVDFKVLDPINSLSPQSPKTYYEKIAESMDQRVFDASITLFDNTPVMKADSPEVVDIKVEAKMGRVRIVFLMKFVNDFLAFLEPFSGAKEAVAERANMALEGAAKSMIDAYAKATRAQLDIQLDAPLIIIPVHSTSSTAFFADLGTLSIANRFSIEGSNIFDEMHFNLNNLQLFRAKIHDDYVNNEVIASCLVIHPITFELDLKRNMNGAIKKDDPAEISATGTLYEIKVELSKNDYDVMLAILLNNFSEKGSFEKVKSASDVGNKATLSLPVKSKYSGGSRTSLASGHSLQIQEALKVPERDPLAQAVQFNFKFRGFRADLHSGNTPLEKLDEIRNPSTALARIQVKVIAVEGCLLVSSAIEANAHLENCMLEDNRVYESRKDAQRIVRLMEAKPVQGNKGTRMIDIKYRKEDQGDQNIDVKIHSFVLVGSVPYLMEIANFFVQDSGKKYEWQSSEKEVAAVAVETPSKISIFVEIEEPDIFLVENIDDINSDALMLNVEVQFKFQSAQDQISMRAALANIRCHTCRFNPACREETLAQILQPCTLSFTVSQNESHGMRVNANVSDLCLNVSPHSIFIIQNSVQAFVESMAKSEDAARIAAAKKEEDYSALWATKRFENDEFWFLRPDETVDALESMNTLSSNTNVAEDQQAIVNINNLVIKVESGLGNNTIPLLLLESNFNCDVKNWSSKMSLIGTVSLEMAYYNSKLALWEPVIEPVCKVKPDGGLVKKRWDMNVTLQSNSLNDYGSAFASPALDEGDGFLCPENLPPLMMISLTSREILEITVTKTFIGVLSTLGESFAAVTSSKKKELPVAPFIVQNCTGKLVTILLECKGFKYFAKDDKPGRIQQLDLEHADEVHLFLFKDRTQESLDYVSPLQEQTEQSEASLRLRIAGEKGIFDLPVSKADKRFFPFPFRGDEMGDNHGMVSEIKVVNGCKYITLRTIVQVKNHFDMPVNIFTYDGTGRYLRLASLKPDETFNVPIKNVYTSPYEFSFQVEEEGSNMGLECFSWRQLINKPSHAETIHCTNRHGGPDIFLNVEGVREEIFLERTGKLSSVCYVMDIRPILVFKNCLPVALSYSIGENGQEIRIKPGKSSHMAGITLGLTSVALKIPDFRGTDWKCSQVIPADLPELCSWRFGSDDVSEANGTKLDISVNTTVSHGTRVVSIFSPFWMLNKTGKTLTYRGQDNQNGIYHSPDLDKTPMMFSYTAKSFMGKKKACVRIDDSSWSDPFTLDTIEDAGKVTCKKGASGKKQPYSVGVNISMSKSSLTKIITITPYYIVLNTAEFSISVREFEGTEFVEVPPGDCVPFWPAYGGATMIACVTGTPELTPIFSMQAESSSLLILDNKYGAINVESKMSNSECLLTLSSYSRGLAPVQLINSSQTTMIEYWESGATTKQFLPPCESVLYTWRNPSGPRKLKWSISEYSDEYLNTLVSDGQGMIELDANKYLGWVSFLDGMQRVLLFTDDPNLCYSMAKTTGENERIEQEIEVNIHGIGISVVNNAPSCSYELLYTSITSSDIVWEIKKKGKTRFKSLTRAQCDSLEDDFQIYLREKSVGKRTSDQRTLKVFNSKDIVVNYQDSKMMQPLEGTIRRQFQKGLWLQMRSSVHQRQIHAKINRIQIDNQMGHCLFPVIMSPVPPPKSVIAESIPKPFIELSVLEYKSPEHTNLRQFKYVHALVQELHIKVDQGLLNALMDLFEEEEILDEDINEFLKEDLTLASKPLKDIARLQVTKGLKDFFDFLHLSPLKVHISFSLTSYSSSSKINATRRSNFLGLFLQSLGVTITDTDDIIFRLAYFERKHSFFTQQDLMSEMIRHYTSQAIKQAYVIIFGLDVIGNPFGLVVGVSRSVEDLFYEPFQGAVEGPSEFAEGLVIGVRSVFSGVVGGAAGTFSRITGAFGKGLASLTFDEKFQSKRREAIKKRGTQTLGESFARSGKGLVMGFVDGVTGVATKPFEGAVEEGVGGFFKGVGKGVVGLVARPTGGIIDFASGTFDSVKRVTEVTEEIGRIRPARFLHPDGVVTNYNLREALGNKILKELEKGRLADSDVYVTHAEITADRNSAFLITSKRVLFVVYTQVLGTWAVDWEFEYGAINGPPPTGKEPGEDGTGERWYILIKPKEERKKVFGIFGGSERGKKVFMSNREAVQSLARTDRRSADQSIVTEPWLVHTCDFYRFNLISHPMNNFIAYLYAVKITPVDTSAVQTVVWQ